MHLKGIRTFVIKGLLPNTTIRNLKVRVANRSAGNLPAEQQRLFFEGVELENDDQRLFTLPRFQSGVAFECVLGQLSEDENSITDPDLHDTPTPQPSRLEDPLLTGMNEMNLG